MGYYPYYENNLSNCWYDKITEDSFVPKKCLENYVKNEIYKFTDKKEESNVSFFIAFVIALLIAFVVVFTKINLINERLDDIESSSIDSRCLERLDYLESSVHDLEWQLY
jgi:hypothetical protein